MITRITLAVVALAACGWLAETAAAQTYYPIIPTGFMAPLSGCDGGACDQGTCDAAGCDLAGCDGQTCDDCSGRWLTAGLRGTGHDPTCRCPRCHPRHIWAGFDALLWWGKGRTMPAVATTSPQGTPQAAAGVLPGAGILFGNGVVGSRMAAGARADFGVWLDDYENLGIGARVWGIDGDRQALQANSPTGTPILARPFFNPVLNQEDSVLVAFPGIITGNLAVSADSSVLGTEGYLRTNMLSGCDYDLDLMGGYHFVRLDDELSILSDSVSINPAGPVAVGTQINIRDVFDASNQFHGGEVGLLGEFRKSCWKLTGLAKISVGNMHQTVRIDGSTTIAPPASATVVSRGGVLAQPTNMNTYSRDVTAVIPEITLTAAYEVTNWLELTMGYNAIYLSNVVLSGDQIDRTVNPTQFAGNPLIGPARPTFTMQDTDYWLHGLTLGATVTY